MLLIQLHWNRWIDDLSDVDQFFVCFFLLIVVCAVFGTTRAVEHLK